jgi:hypothetical protein
MPKASPQLLDPGLSRTELLNQHAKRLACQKRQSHITGIFDDRNEFLHLRRPLSDDQSELRTVAAQCIDHHGALTDQKFTGPVQHQNRLLLGAFRRRKPHRRTRHRLADRFRIRRVVLVRLDEGTHILWRDQPDLMAQRLYLTRPVVRRGAGFHADKTGWQSGEKRQHLPAPQLPAQRRAPFSISTVNLEHRLCQIKPDRRNIHGGRSLCLDCSTRSSMAHREAVGGVHTITLNGRSTQAFLTEGFHAAAAALSHKSNASARHSLNIGRLMR